MPIGGWTGWPYAIGSAMLLKNAIGEDIKTYCILDSDYHTAQEKNQRIKDAENKFVELHIWDKKEIENYLIVPSAIVRIINNKKGNNIISLKIVEKALEDIANELKDSTTDCIAQEIFNLDRSKGLSKANSEARYKVQQAWKTHKGKMSIISGKRVLSLISEWSKENYDVSFGIMTIVREIRRDELDSELIKIINSIEKSTRFS
jgi:hypothetical protein